jgi:subtilisin family serine protease
VDRILKIFASGDEQDAAADGAAVVERYDGFVVVDATAAEAKRLARRFPVEDITDQYVLHVGDRTIDTSTPRVDETGATRAHPAYRAAKALPKGRHHYLVQFVGPIKDAWLRAVRRAGGEPRQHYNGFVYVVRADERAIAKIAALRSVRWVGHLPYRARLSQPLREGVAGAGPLPRARALPDMYAVEFFGPDDAKRGATELRRAGFEVVSTDLDVPVVVVRVDGTAAARRKKLDDAARIHGVRKIRRRAVPRTANDVAVGIMGTARSLASPGLGLSGKGEIVGVCDTGLDTGDPATIHPDFAGRVAAVKSYPIVADFASHIRNPGGDDGAADVDSGHGTHVAGSVLGNGAASNGVAGLATPIRGCAYNATLVFQAVEQALDWKDPDDLDELGRHLLAGIPNDLRTLFSFAYGKGVRIHSNSWGGGDPGAYDHQCRALDAFVWGHKDFCILFAAGNDGTDSDADGRINPTSVTSPGTAKNCITVGASESVRKAFDAERYGDWWPNDYPVAPFRDDPMANDAKAIVPFSSRGPTIDRRFKPDVVAPGTFILSTRSRMIAANNTAWAPLPQSRSYFFMGGTSMATPLTAGAVALLREFLRRRRRIASPSAALLKAALIAGATRLPGAPGTVDNDQGYGLVNVDAVVAPSGATARFADVAPGLRTGQIATRTLTVRSSGRPLRIVLAYSDYPGPALVNNLNLIVTSPDGRRFVGNQTGARALSSLDATNNVEVVNVARAQTGRWRVDVIGSNVPRGPQDYALVTIAAS